MMKMYRAMGVQISRDLAAAAPVDSPRSASTTTAGRRRCAAGGLGGVARGAERVVAGWAPAPAADAGAAGGSPGWAVPAGGAGGWLSVAGIDGVDLQPVDHREDRPLAAGQQGQRQAEDEEGGGQDPGDAGQQVAGAARGHEARRAAAHAERAALRALQQHHRDQGDADDDVDGEQNAEEHCGVRCVRAATPRRNEARALPPRRAQGQPGVRPSQAIPTFSQLILETERLQLLPLDAGTPRCSSRS